MEFLRGRERILGWLAACTLAGGIAVAMTRSGESDQPVYGCETPFEHHLLKNKTNLLIIAKKGDEAYKLTNSSKRVVVEIGKVAAENKPDTFVPSEQQKFKKGANFFQQKSFMQADGGSLVLTLESAGKRNIEVSALACEKP